MDTVVISPPEHLIAERQRLGLDLFDEVWGGEYHMVPNPSGEHQRIGIELAIVLRQAARSVGLEVLYEFGLVGPGEPGWNDFRVPDLIVFPPSSYEDRAVVGPPALVVEIRSPGDESFLKLPFYERTGTREVLILDRDRSSVRRWLLGPAGLVERPPAERGIHWLATLPIGLRAVAGECCAFAEGRVVAI